MFVQAKVYTKFAPSNAKMNFLALVGESLIILELAHGVTGNTSVFGTEESRFEP